MKFEYVQVDNLPPLAWCAEIENGNIRVFHGDKVETKDKFFVEGAWNGDFEKGDFINTDWFCGTGAVIEGDKCVFSTPTHVTCGLYVTKMGGGRWKISNSLYLLMVRCDYHLDNQYLYYEADFNTIIGGIHEYKKDIHCLNAGNMVTSVDVYYFRNIILNGNGLEEYVKGGVEPFVNFDDYYKRLSQAMVGISNNAKDTQRKFQYGVVTTVSKGYDSPCCAVMGKLMGSDVALTFNAEGKYEDDSGVEIAKILGYSTIIERDALAYKTRNDMVECFSVASGELGANVSESSFFDDYRGNLVLTGDRGDSVWDKNAFHRNRHCQFVDVLNHLSDAETRLWFCYVPVPVPLYGAFEWPSMYEIANSEEMEHWSIGGSYDRPLPRRIVENAGVTRESFGIAKHGAGFTYRYDWQARILRRMSDVAAKNFEKFVKQNRETHVLEVIRYFIKTRNVYLKRLGFNVKIPKATELSKISNPMAPRYLIPWAGGYVLNKYKDIVKGF